MKTTEIFLYDEIGLFGVSAKQFVQSLAAIPKDSHIKLRLNSPGGDVFDGLAIYNALVLHPGGITVLIDGLAASIASVIATAGKTIVMPENAFMMVHNAWGVVIGDHEEMREFANTMEKITASIANTYSKRTGQSSDKIAELMADETWMTAAEAKELGFADEVTEPVKMAARVRLDRFNKAPAALVAMNPPARSPKPGDPTPAPSDPPEPIVAVLARASEKTQLIARSCAENRIPELTAELMDEFGSKPIEDIHAFFSEASKIRDMCTAARLPEEAPRFIRARMPVETCRNLLFEVLQARDSLNIDNKIDPPTGEKKKTQVIDIDAIYKRRNDTNGSDEIQTLRSLRNLIDGRIKGRH